MRRLLSVALLIAATVLAPVGAGLVNAASASAQQRRTPPSEIKVWVNNPTGVYHCPGTRWYGNTKKGEYMTQAQALAAGHRAAYGRQCQ